MRVLVTGGAGLVGRTLLATAPAGAVLHATQRQRPVTGAQAHRVDLADTGAVTTLWDRVRPDVVIHTAYDKRDGERDIVAASRVVAAASRATGAGLVHLSTDVVFDGEHAPYGENAAPAPMEQYGRWKAQAERDVMAAHPRAAIVRTSIVIAEDASDPSSRWVLDSVAANQRPALFTDELRCPSLAGDLAAALWELVALPEAERQGPWHLAGPEAVSRWTLGHLLTAHAGLPPAFTPARNADHPTPRPRDVRLSTGRADAALDVRIRPIGAALAALDA